jgi:hypothetical protein
MKRDQEFLVRCVYAATQVTLRLLASDEDDAEHQVHWRQKGAVYYAARPAPDPFLNRSPWAHDATR